MLIYFSCQTTTQRHTQKSVPLMFVKDHNSNPGANICHYVLQQHNPSPTYKNSILVNIHTRTHTMGLRAFTLSLSLTFGLQYCISLRFESWNDCFLKRPHLGAVNWGAVWGKCFPETLDFSPRHFLCIFWWNYCLIVGSLRENMIHLSLMLEQTQGGGMWLTGCLALILVLCSSRWQ